MCGEQAVQYKMADLYAPGRAECRHTSRYPREVRRCCRAAADPQLPACIIIIRRDQGSVANPDPSDLYVLGPPGSGSVSQRYGSGSFYHQAKIVIKPFIPTVL
jgi:hypothetical protein